jgi:hypothetical protein
MKKVLKILENILNQIIAEFDCTEYFEDPEIRNLLIFLLCAFLIVSLSGPWSDFEGIYPLKEIRPTYGVV